MGEVKVPFLDLKAQYHSIREEIDHAIAVVTGAIDKLREMSPLWEMVQEGVDLKTIQWDAH